MLVRTPFVLETAELHSISHIDEGIVESFDRTKLAESPKPCAARPKRAFESDRLATTQDFL
jgi:hypothetical protein